MVVFVIFSFFPIHQNFLSSSLPTKKKKFAQTIFGQTECKMRNWENRELHISCEFWMRVKASAGHQKCRFQQELGVYVPDRHWQEGPNPFCLE